MFRLDRGERSEPAIHTIFGLQVIGSSDDEFSHKASKLFQFFFGFRLDRITSKRVAPSNDDVFEVSF